MDSKLQFLRDQAARMGCCVIIWGPAVLARQRTRYGLRAMAAVSVSVIALNALLVFSGLTRTEKIVGPFEPETKASQALIVHLNTQSKLRRLLSTGGDSSGNPNRSSLSLTLNGVPFGPAHSRHDKIRNDATAAGAYSHWHDLVIFSLPRAFSNSREVELLAEYPISLSPILVSGSGMLLALSLVLIGLCKRMSDRGEFDRLVATGQRLFFLASRGAWLSLFVAAAAFLATIVYGFVAGYYLPNTAVFAIFPWVKPAALFEPSVPYVVLTYALVGVVLAWMALLSEPSAHDFHSQEQRLVSLFSRFGFVCLLGYFMFSVGATWAGVPRPQDLSGSSIGGLVPFSDATGHFSMTFGQAISGRWDPFASRRPVAAALRSAGMFLTGYSNPAFLGMQTVLMALATFFAARSVMYWRGLWAGLTFLGLTLILVRPYVPTNLTEPLGILLALIGVPFLIQAISGGSLASKSLGLLFACLALAVRMGNMLFLPAFSLWIVLSSEPSRRARRNAVLVAFLTVSFVFAFSATLSKLYGSREGGAATNFADTFCGLAHNGDWTRCGELYADELRAFGSNEASRAAFQYRRGLERISAEPSLFVQRTASGAVRFLLRAPFILLKGYVEFIPDFFPVVPWYGVCLFGLCGLMKKCMSRHEKIFWTLFAASLIGAASIVYFDDGVRVLCVSFPLLSLFVASGFSTQASSAQPCVSPSELSSARPSTLVGLAVLVCIVSTCLILPWAAHKFDPLNSSFLNNVSKNPNEDLYLASRYMTGFVVVADDVPMPTTVPAMSMKAFTQIVINSGIEQYEDLVSVAPPATPFAIVAAPGLVANGGRLLILPPDVFLDRATVGWKVRYVGGSYWRRVAHADPIYRAE